MPGFSLGLQCLASVSAFSISLQYQPSASGEQLSTRSERPKLRAHLHRVELLVFGEELLPRGLVTLGEQQLEFAFLERPDRIAVAHALVE